jgi:hypothetical protein
MNLTKQIETKRELLTKLTAFYAVTLQFEGNEQLKVERWDYWAEEMGKATCPQVDLFEDAELILEIVPEEHFDDVFRHLLEASDNLGDRPLVTISALHFNPLHLKTIKLWFDSALNNRYRDTLYCELIKTDSWKTWTLEFAQTDFRTIEAETLLSVFELVIQCDFIYESIDSGIGGEVQKGWFFLDCIKAGLYPWDYISQK